MRLVRGGITNRCLRRAVALVETVARDRDMTKSLCTLLFDSDCVPVPANFLAAVARNVCDMSEFCRRATEMIDCAFWQAEQPNVSAVLNARAIPKMKNIVNGREKEFLEIIERGVDNFDGRCFPGLCKLIECVWDRAGADRYAVVLRTMLKTRGRDLGYEAFGSVARLIGTALARECDGALDMWEKMREEISAFGDGAILVKSEVARVSRSQALADEIVQEFADGNCSISATVTRYLALRNVMPLVNIGVACDLIAKALILDYDRCCEYLRVTIEGLVKQFLKEVKKDHGELGNVLMKKLQILPLKSPSMKFALSCLLDLCPLERNMWGNVIELLSDPLAVGYAAKIVPKDGEFARMLFDVAMKITETQFLIPIHVLLSPLCKGIGGKELLEMFSRPTDDFHRTWFGLELSIGAPKILDDAVLRSHLRYASRAYNWDLRTRAIQAFSVSMFPKETEDEEIFLELLDSAAALDSPTHQSCMVSFLEPVIGRLSQDCTSKIRVILSDLTGVDSPPLRRDFGLHIAKLLPRANNRSSPNNEELPIPADLDLATVAKFAKSVRHHSPTKEAVSWCLENLKPDHNWKVLRELISIAVTCLDQMTNDQIHSATRVVFESLISTRKPGFITSSIDSFSVLLERCQPGLCLELTDCLLSSLSVFDMSAMRRSAGLPYLSVTLSRVSPTSFHKIMSFICHQTANDTITTNSLNILRNLLLDTELSELMEQYLPSIFRLIFDSASSKSWDVISAVNLVFTAFMRKILKWFDSPKSVLFEQFAHRVPGSIDILKSSLSGSSHHTIYLALIFLASFENSSAGSDLAPLVLTHLSSRNIRIRRAAARAFRSQDASSSLIDTLKHEKTTDSNTRQGIQFAFGNFQPVSSNTHDHYNALHRRLCGEPTPELITSLKNTLLSPNMAHLNRALVTDGLRFLTVNAGTIEAEYIPVIISLISSETSPTIQALLVDLLRAAHPQDSHLAELLSLFFDVSISWRDEVTPLLCAIARISSQLSRLEGGVKICFLLALSDIPLVRSLVCGNTKETIVAKSLLSRLSLSDKLEIAQRWLDKIEGQLGEDTWGETITSFVGEFYITNCLIDGALDFYRTSIANLDDLHIARRQYLTHCREHCHI